MRVLLTSRLHGEALGRLAGHEVDVYAGPNPMPGAELARRIAGADGLICFPFDRIGRDVIDAGSGLRAISTYSVGYDHIDVSYARGRGIAVGHTPDVLTAATADLALALILDVTRRVSEGDRMVRGGRWTQMIGARDYVGAGLQGRTLGVLGMGRIGRAVASRAAAFGMKVIYHSRRPVDGIPGHCTLGELASRSDIVSVHAPLSPATEGIVGEGFIRMMRRGAYLVNTSRGALVDEEALAAALRDGRLAGAGLDVLRKEPAGAGHLLASLGNVVATPHIGSATEEARLAMSHMAVENVLGGMEGRGAAHPV